MGCSVVLVPPRAVLRKLKAVLFGEPISLPLIGTVDIVRSAWFAEAGVHASWAFLLSALPRKSLTY